MENQEFCGHDVAMWKRRVNEWVGGSMCLLLVGCAPTRATGIDPDTLKTHWSEPATSIGVWTTEESVESDQDAVSRAFTSLMQRRIACGRQPETCDVSTLAVPGSSVAVSLTRLMNERRQAGITASSRGSMKFRLESVELISPDTANVTTCTRDDTVLMIDSAIFDDSTYSARTKWTLQRIDGRWLWSDEDVIEWVLEEEVCDP